MSWSTTLISSTFAPTPSKIPFGIWSKPSVLLSSGDRLRVPLKTRIFRSSYVAGALATWSSMNRWIFPGIGSFRYRLRLIVSFEVFEAAGPAVGVNAVLTESFRVLRLRAARPFLPSVQLSA